MSEEYQDRQVDRRQFLKGAAVTAVAATATGAGAAALTSRPSTPVTFPAPPAMSVGQTITTGSAQVAELLGQLAAVQAENMRLQADLAAAQRRIEAQPSEGIETAVQAMSVELDAANGRVGLLSGLLALYEQLDDVDVADWVEDGVNVVNSAITELVADLPSLTDGIARGEQVLAELDEHIPLLENGRAWLTQQTDKLQRSFDAIEQLLVTAVEQVGPFLQMFSEWVQAILKWLPFGLGQRTSEIMDALTSLLLETPHTISGIQTNVAQPLDVWLGSDGEMPLRQHIVKPLQEQLLPQAAQVAEKTTNVQAIYQENVTLPLETAVASRRHIRHLITAYRQQHQL